MKPLRVELTVKLLLDSHGDSVYTALEDCKNFYLPRPEKPAKPLPPKNRMRDMTSTDLLNYSKEVEDYEAKMVIYNEASNIYSVQRQKVDEIAENYIKEVSGLHKIPEQYQSKVWSLAYEYGSSYGLNEVYIKLCDIVAIF